MASPAHSLFFEDPTPPQSNPKSAEQIAIEMWGGRERRLAHSIVAILDELYEGEWQWTVSEHIFGVPADSEIITDTVSNGDGTRSGLLLAG